MYTKQPHWASGHFMMVFYKRTTCLRQTLQWSQEWSSYTVLTEEFLKRGISTIDNMT